MVHLRRTNESAAKAADTQDEQCNEPQPQDPVSETHELPSQTATEAPSQGSTEVHPPATPVKAPELEDLSASAESRNTLRTMFSLKCLSRELLQLKTSFPLFDAYIFFFFYKREGVIM